MAWHEFGRRFWGVTVLAVLAAGLGCRAGGIRHAVVDGTRSVPVAMGEPERRLDCAAALHTVACDRALLVAETTAAGPEDESVSASQVVDLGTLFGMVDGQNPQVALARERIAEAYARSDRAKALWLPSVRAGLNYNKHEGAIQDVAGRVFDTSRGDMYGGLGASAVGAASPAVPGVWANFHLADACFQPRIAGHEASARSQAAQAARNALLRDAAVAYWELARAEQQQAVARETIRHTQELARVLEAYSRTGEGLTADARRVQAELAVRQGELLQVEEAQRVAAAQLARLLGVDPQSRLASAEPAVVPLALTPRDAAAVELVQQGLSQRPELAESRHLVCEACQRLQRERLAPLIPSVVLGLSYGAFGGGLGGDITHTRDRLDADAAAYWELRQLGLGDRAAQAEAASRVRQAELRQVAELDRVAQEVVAAHAQMQARAGRIEIVRAGLPPAEESFRLNWERIQHAQGLPIEVLQSVQALAQIRREYLNAVVDYNIAQFQLWWATGWFSEPAAPRRAE